MTDKQLIAQLEKDLTEERVINGKALEKHLELLNLNIVLETKLKLFETQNKQLQLDRVHAIEAAKKHEQQVGLFMRWDKPRLERENDLLTKILKEAKELIRELRDIIKMNTDDIKLKEDKILELSNKLKLCDEQIKRMFDCCGGEKCIGTESCVNEKPPEKEKSDYEMTECPGCRFSLVLLEGDGPIYNIKCPDCGWSGRVIKTDIATNNDKCTLCKGEGHRPVMCTCEVCHGTGKR
jgi:hypothetical protein